MLRYILLITTLLATINAKADHTRYMQFDETDSVYQSYCSHVRVIDMRQDKETIGMVLTGIATQRDIITQLPLDKTLEAYYDKILSHKEQHELVMVIYDMWIETRATASLYMDCDYFSSNGSGQYQYLGKVSRMFEHRHNLNIANKELETAQELIRDNTLHFAVPAPKPLSPDILTEEQMLKRRVKEKQGYPIYNLAAYKPGIYTTAQDFIAGTPLDTPFTHSYINMGNTPQLYFYYTKPNGKKGDRIHDNEYFAIYDGKQWYVSDHKKIRKLNFENGEFHTTKSFVSNNSNAGLMFGAIGALAVAATTPTQEAESSGEYDAIFDPGMKDFKLIRHK